MKGLYILINTINGKQYVGKSSNLPRRVNKHLRGTYRQPTYIHNAIRKYGKDAFDVELIPYPGISCEALCAVEKWKIRQFGTKTPNGYNLTDGGDGSLGYKHTPETRRKLSELGKGNKNTLGHKLTPEHRRKISEARKGRKHTPKARQKMSEAQKGRVVTPETRRKISELKKGNKYTLGYKHTPEARQKMSETKKKQFDEREDVKQARLRYSKHRWDGLTHKKAVTAVCQELELKRRLVNKCVTKDDWKSLFV